MKRKVKVEPTNKDVLAKRVTLMPVLNADEVNMLIFTNYEGEGQPEIRIQMTYEQAGRLYTALATALNMKVEFIEQMMMDHTLGTVD